MSLKGFHFLTILGEVDSLRWFTRVPANQIIGGTKQ